MYDKPTPFSSTSLSQVKEERERKKDILFVLRDKDYLISSFFVYSSARIHALMIPGLRFVPSRSFLLSGRRNDMIISDSDATLVCSFRASFIFLDLRQLLW